MSDFKDTVSYEVNGRTYTFKVKLIDNGIPYGYCAVLGKYAWLYDTYFWTDNEGIVVGTRVG